MNEQKIAVLEGRIEGLEQLIEQEEMKLDDVKLALKLLREDREQLKAELAKLKLENS